METYFYACDDGIERWGYRIYETDEKLRLSYEAAGFDTEADALADMNQTLKDFNPLPKNYRER